MGKKREKEEGMSTKEKRSIIERVGVKIEKPFGHTSGQINRREMHRRAGKLSGEKRWWSRRIRFDKNRFPARIKLFTVFPSVARPKWLAEMLIGRKRINRWPTLFYLASDLTPRSNLFRTSTIFERSSTAHKYFHPSFFPLSLSLFPWYSQKVIEGLLIFKRLIYSCVRPADIVARNSRPDERYKTFRSSKV